MSGYELRWGLVVLLAGGWAAGLFAGQSVGPTIHLLLLAAVALAVVQLRTKPAQTAFQLWQGKQQTRKPSTKRR